MCLSLVRNVSAQKLTSKVPFVIRVCTNSILLILFLVLNVVTDFLLNDTNGGSGGRCTDLVSNRNVIEGL